MSTASRPSAPPLLELRDLTKRFGAHAAVDRLSLSIGAGEFLTVLGASGSGKTTTLRLIAGFERATSGQILMDGVDLAGLPAFKRPINTVFQQYALFPHLNVRDNVAYGLRMQRVPEGEISTRVQQALEMVQLGPMGDRAPRTLSGGQQQRVALARALVNRPRVLLLDEPLGALDLKLRRAMQLELKQLQTRLAITFIYVTHDQEEALTMSDRIALMRDGRIEQLGTPRDMYDRPRTRYVADFIGETNLVPVTVASVDRAIVTLQVGEHTVCAPAADGAAAPGGAGSAPVAGKSAWLSVRPEAVSVVGRGDGGTFACTLPAKVTGMVYAGSAVKVHLALDGGTAMVAQLPPGADVPMVGAICLAAWSPERGVLMAE